jgi:UDP-N-acetylmuramoyl-tripeptide--D-alanyl-D-alanine ligase
MMGVYGIAPPPSCGQGKKPMPEFEINEIARIVDGEVAGPPSESTFHDYHFDSRQVGDGTLFFALTTERNDGHNYLPDVARFRGTGAVVRRDVPQAGRGLPLIRVADPEAAYRALALHVRRTLAAVRYIGITGSAGKTTTKEFTHQILAHRYRSYRAPGNWNNWIGVPFALLKMGADVERAVFELAMSDPGRGEIDYLAGLLRPHVAVVLNALPVHLEFLKTVENVALAKMEILNHLADDDVALVNGDYEPLRRLAAGSHRPVILFGRYPGVNEVALSQVIREPDSTRLVIRHAGQEYDFVSDVRSDAQVENLFAAILAAWQSGMTFDDIREPVRAMAVPAGRGVIHRRGGIIAVDETYNSNPAAVKKLLTWASGAYSRPLTAVLGDMLELGEDEEEYHRDVGRHFASLGYTRLIAVGPRAAWLAEGARESGFPAKAIVCCETASAAGQELARQMATGHVYVFKASRGIRLEKALQMLLAAAEQSHKSDSD